MSGIINATNLEVANIKDSTGTNTAMTISGTGVVTPKTTSYVWVYPQGTSGYTSVAANAFVPFNTIYQSAGSGSSDFNTSTYKYTAPVKGLYYIEFRTISSLATDNKAFRLNVDGNVISQTFWARDTRACSGSPTILLNANQVVGIDAHGTSYYYRNSNTMPHEDVYTRMIINLIEELT